MPGELFMNGELNEAFSGASTFAQHGLAGTKGALLGGGSLLVTVGLGIAAKKKLGAASGGGGEHGRLKRVEQGELGLREHNNKFYKLKPIKVDGEIIGQEKKFYELMEPGLRIAPVPWFKYKLLNTQNDQ